MLNLLFLCVLMLVYEKVDEKTLLRSLVLQLQCDVYSRAEQRAKTKQDCLQYFFTFSIDQNDDVLFAKEQSRGNDNLDDDETIYEFAMNTG